MREAAWRFDATPGGGGGRNAAERSPGARPLCANQMAVAVNGGTADVDGKWRVAERPGG